MMRRLLVMLFLFPGLVACSSAGDTPMLEAAPPAADLVTAGILTGINDSHFEQPIEVTDVYRAPPSSTSQWMVCIRSAKSDESRRQNYSAFFGTTGYVQSRYSVVVDGCGGQQFHPFVDPATIPPPAPKKTPQKPSKKPAG
jgi:hypothetical protein